MKIRLLKSSKGFSLVEVVVAIAILVGAVLVVSNTWSGNVLRLRKANLNSNVATLLERKAVELESLYKEKNLAEIPEELSGDFGSGFGNYRWTMKTKAFDMPDLSPILIGRDGGADDMLLQMMRQMRETMNAAIKEAKVSVYVKTKSKELEYFVTFYFVNYDVQVPGVPQ